jgi:glycosyltransferase involved in cell wall biosynthesis
MRIAYLSVSDQLGGSEIALLEMIKGVRRVRPDWPLHLVLPGRGPLLAQAEAAGADCTVLTLPAPLASLGESAAEDARWSLATRARLALRLATVAFSLPGYVRRLRKLLRSIDPVIVHSNGLKAHVTAARAISARPATRELRPATPGPRSTAPGLRSTVPGPRLIWHIHDYIGPRRVTRSLLRAHEDRAAAVIANSASVAADLASVLSPSVRVDVVHNAVDLSTFTPEGPAQDLDARVGWRPSTTTPVVRVGLVATFARWKGHEVFLRAIAALPPDLPVRAYVVGGALYDTAGSQYSQEELEALARTLGVQDRVGFTGFLPPAAAMRALDVVVHASTRPEPFGLVIAEAMACGRAVITSASGGAAELIEPEVDALTHTPGDAADLSRTIARVVSDASLRARLGTHARAAACRRFDPDRLARDLVNVYEQSVH